MKAGSAGLLWFFALAFAWSWAGWLAASLLKPTSPIAATVAFLVAGPGPSLAAIAVVTHQGGRAALRAWLKRFLQWRAGWRWISLAYFFPVVFKGLAAVAHVALGGALPDSPAKGQVLLAAVNFSLVFLIGGPLGEEFGWRGLAQPALVLHTAVNAWSSVIPVMVRPDGGNLRPLQFVVAILVATAVMMLIRADPVPP